VKPAPGGKAWTVKTGKGIFSSPVVGADETVYVGSADRYFYAISPEGEIVWKILTGEIIDSSALLDDKGRVYFGSGDGKLRALEAKTGNEVWTFSADDPSVNSAYINWFEGNVAIGRDGTLYVPNDNYFLYAIDRDTGAVKWKKRLPDQTWSLPAVDGATDRLFMGNNNLLPLLGKNTFSFDATGETLWDASSLGTIAASALLTGDGKMVLGGFDGYVRAYDMAAGAALWELPTRDHVYASPALLPDGTVVQASCDGTVYGIDPVTGKARWAFDTLEPIRSSPAVDGDGNIYFGTGEGKLFALRSDGTFRWAMQLVSGDRNDINASPALGRKGIYVASESGEIFSVPYGACEGESVDARCLSTAGEDLPAEGAFLYATSSLGALRQSPPDVIDGNEPLALSLVVRKGGDTVLALLDPASLTVTVDPPAEVKVDVSGDGRFVTLSPEKELVPGADGRIRIDVAADYLVGFERNGLRLSGGSKGGDVSFHLEPQVRPANASSPALVAPSGAGSGASTWELSRLALPLPTILPSYNQIGFDSLHFLVGLVELEGERGVAWMIGAKLAEGENRTVVDPKSRAVFPLAVRYHAGELTLDNQDGLRVEVMNVAIPFRSFRVAGRLGSSGAAEGTVRVSGSTVCETVPTYGAFLQKLGLCNPKSDVLSVFGGALLDPWEGGLVSAPAGVGTASFARAGDAVEVTLSGSSLRASEHVLGLLLVDATTGTPVTLDYGLSTTHVDNADGTLLSVRVPFGATAVPANIRAYLMIDTSVGASGTPAM
jgi:outer membrane protein assembly factor BamB